MFVVDSVKTTLWCQHCFLVLPAGKLDEHRRFIELGVRLFLDLEQQGLGYRLSAVGLILKRNAIKL